VTLRASVRHTDARHRQGAQATDREHSQAGSRQPAMKGSDQSGRGFLNSNEQVSSIKVTLLAADRNSLA
jgi:hypothetical protein